MSETTYQHQPKQTDIPPPSQVSQLQRRPFPHEVESKDNKSSAPISDESQEKVARARFDSGMISLYPADPNKEEKQEKPIQKKAESHTDDREDDPKPIQKKAESHTDDREDDPKSVQRKAQEPEQPDEAHPNKLVQTKLTVGKPGDRYEQEADQVAAKVMTMPEPAHNRIQRQSEASEANIQPKSLATSITPLVQRQASEEVQTKAGNKQSNSVNTEFENRLASTAGGGSPLSGEVRSFMEPRFGVDLGHVRVHTGADAAHLNKDVRAQAFTYRNHIFYAAGKSPGKDELTAHELTHVIQQTGGNKLQRQPLDNREPMEGKEKNSSFALPANAIVPLQRKNKVNPLPTHDSDTPVIQAKCAACEAKGKIHRKPIDDNKLAPVEQTEPAIQRWPGLRLPNRQDAEHVGRGLRNVAGAGVDVIQGDYEGAVRRFAPQLADLMSRNPVEWLIEKIKMGVQNWLRNTVGKSDIVSTVTQLKETFSGLLIPVMKMGQGDPASCAAFAQSVKSLQDLGEAFMNNPAVKRLQAGFERANQTFEKILDVVIAPALDAVKGAVGSIFEGITSLATTIWNWTAPLRNAIGAAWNWVKGKLGIGGDGEGGVLGWLKEKAKEAWERIKGPLAPVIEPLKKVGLVLIATNPLVILAAVIKFMPQIIQWGKWLWKNRNSKDIVNAAKNDPQVGKSILPKLLSGLQQFGRQAQSAVKSLIDKATSLSEGLLNLLGAISGIPLLGMARGLVQTVTDGVKGFVTWGREKLQTGAKIALETTRKIVAKIKPLANILGQIVAVAINPAGIVGLLAGGAWRLLDDCYKAPIINLLLDIVIKFLRKLPSLPMFGLLWPLLKTAMLGFLEGLKSKSDKVKVAITNRIARIISGGSPAFALQFIKGLFKGIWETIFGPFKAIYDIISGFAGLVTWFRNQATQLMAPRPKTQAAAANKMDKAEFGKATQGTVPAEQQVAGNPDMALGAQFRQMGGELQPPANKIRKDFMPAAREAFSGDKGGTSSPGQLSQQLGDLWNNIEKKIRQSANQIAQKICNFLIQGGSEGKMGDKIGFWVGMIGSEVALTLLTWGTWVPVSAGLKLIKGIAHVLNFGNKIMEKAFGALLTIGKFALKGLRSLSRFLARKAGRAIKGVLGALGEIGQKLVKFAEELLERLKRRRPKRPGKPNPRLEDDAARLAARKQAELPAALAQAKTITKASKAVRMPISLLLGILNLTLKRRYSWIKSFRAEPKGVGRHAVLMLASIYTVEENYESLRASDPQAFERLQKLGARQGSQINQILQQAGPDQLIRSITDRSGEPIRLLTGNRNEGLKHIIGRHLTKNIPGTYTTYFDETLKVGDLIDIVSKTIQNGTRTLDKRTGNWVYRWEHPTWKNILVIVDRAGHVVSAYPA